MTVSSIFTDIEALKWSDSEKDSVSFFLVSQMLNEILQQPHWIPTILHPPWGLANIVNVDVSLRDKVNERCVCFKKAKHVTA